MQNDLPRNLASDNPNTGFSILRVATYPTVQKNGVGLPAYMLAGDKRYSTIYRAPLHQNGDVPLDLPNKSVDLRFIPFNNRAMPEDRQLSRRTVMAFSHRISAVALLSMRLLIDKKASQVDLVHIHSPMYAAIAAYAKLRKISTVITIHGTDFIRLRDSRNLRRLLMPIDRILSVSDHFASELRTLFPEKIIETVYNGVDTALFSPSGGLTSERRNQIISVGSLRWHKDQQTLIMAFAQLAHKHANWDLVVVGEGELRQKLVQTAASYGLANRIRFPGTLSHEMLAKELSVSKIFALSSVTEGLPKALLEAMASGCACISTDVGECRAVLNDSGLIVDPRDPTSLAQALDSLIGSCSLVNTLGAKAINRAQNFTWQSYRDKHMAIYQSLLGHRL